MSTPRFSGSQLVVACLVSGLVGAGIVGALGSSKKANASGKGVAAVAPIVAELERTGHAARAAAVSAACQRQDACDCGRGALVEALDQELHDVVLKNADAAFDLCPSGELDGVQAEALARGRSIDEAIRVASEHLKNVPEDPFALYGLAHAYYVKGDVAETKAFLIKAIAAKRGEAAHLLAGLIAYQERNYAEAEQSFRAMLDLNPQSVAGLYNLGVTAVARDDYREARERFLAALRIDAKHQGSRYNLAIVTHARGAHAEAEHHMAEFAKLVEVTDPRLAQLRARMSKPVVTEPIPVPAAGGAGSMGAGATPTGTVATPTGTVATPPTGLSALPGYPGRVPPVPKRVP